MRAAIKQRPLKDLKKRKLMKKSQKKFDKKREICANFALETHY